MQTLIILSTAISVINLVSIGQAKNCRLPSLVLISDHRNAHCAAFNLWFFVVDLLFVVTSIAGVFNCSMFCLTLLYVPSSFASILMGKRETVALLSLFSWCLVIGMWLFHAVPWVCLQFVIVVFPDHTHLLFFTVCQSDHLGVSGLKRVKVLLLKRYLVYLKTV